MHSRFITIYLCLISSIFSLLANTKPDPFAQLNITELQIEKQRIIKKLEKLSHIDFNDSFAPVGFRSTPSKNPYQQEWAKITLNKPSPLQEIHLIPSLSRIKTGKAISDAFPTELQIFIGTTQKPEGFKLLDKPYRNGSSQKISPHIFKLNEKEVIWVKVLALKLNKRVWDSLYLFQLSEISLYNQNKNIAFRQQVNVSHENTAQGLEWNKHNLVDGITPFTQNSARGKKSIAFFSISDHNKTLHFDFDLGAPKSLEYAVLNLLEINDTIPAIHFRDLGFPWSYKFIGSDSASFEKAQILYKYERTPFDKIGVYKYDVFTSTNTFRYLRWEVDKLYHNPVDNIFSLGISELQIFSSGKNILKGIVPISNAPSTGPVRKLEAITDSHNYYGKILPFKQWMRELALRQSLEFKLPKIEKLIEKRIAQQKQWILWISITLILGIVFSYIFYRRSLLLRQQAIHQTKEQIAADLHDELGANLHAMVLLEELFELHRHDPEKSQRYIHELKELMQRTLVSVKYCVTVLEDSGLYQDLLEDMKRLSKKLLHGYQYDINFTNSEHLDHLSPRTRIDIFLFYKECLINIIRHSKATIIKTDLSLLTDKLILNIYEDGDGITDNQPPASLIRRSKLMKGQCFLNKNLPEQKGMTITLELPIKQAINNQ